MFRRHLRILRHANLHTTISPSLVIRVSVLCFYRFIAAWWDLLILQSLFFFNVWYPFKHHHPLSGFQWKEPAGWCHCYTFHYGHSENNVFNYKFMWASNCVVWLSFTPRLRFPAHFRCTGLAACRALTRSPYHLVVHLLYTGHFASLVSLLWNTA